MMRFAILSAVMALPLFANQASATYTHGGGSGGGGGGGGGGGVKFTSLTITNKCDGAIAVTINGSELATLEPRQSATYSQPAPKGSQVTLTVGATLVGTSVATSKTVVIKADGKATASITAPTASSLAIGLSGPGLVAGNYREGGILLASTGGLLPLLVLAALFGRPSRV
jgi:hypothetical protein